MKKTKMTVLASALTASTVLAACSGGGGGESGGDGGNGGGDGGGEGEASGEQVVNLAQSADIPSMDPSLTTDTYGIQWTGEIYEGLYRLGENGETEEGIATGEPEVSDDALTYTFNLREDATWTNGDPVTAQDFVYSWQRAVDPETASEYGPYMMGGVIDNATEISEGEADPEELGVEAVDDYTLEVTLEKATPYFESLATFPTFLPLNEEFIEEQEDDYALSPDSMMTNGPFTMEEWNQGESMSFVKNEDYWDADAVQLEEINVQVVKEVSTGVNLYDTGEVDRAGVSAEFVDEYSTEQDFRTVEEPTVFYLKMNQEGNEALDNENIRKAIQMSVDKEGLTNTILNNGSIPAEGLMPANFVFSPDGEEDFREQNGNLAEVNKDEAQDLWEQGLEELGSDSVEVGFLGDDTETAQNTNAYIKEQLETNLEGLTVNVQEVPFQERLDRDTNMDYDMQFAGWGPDYVDPNTFMNLFETDGENNHMGYSSEEYDSLLEEANSELATEPEARWDNFLQMEQILIEEDAAISPLYQRSTAYLWNPALQGVIVNSAGPDFEYKWAYMNEDATEE
ncbi:oligopeptide transport system substrate-binding protein [Marinococcus luteus]|uniref:Oligopeptide transport system substrate-binding protein n=1 Tax=Marinococcus luteus TaxID=1122204 RepID=A0A1H2W783_9BACI|nr:peptide ABC transporter substrate-binding protein [Marinococcus luteus]SDW76286.1 oligopeptide transport system substrate-binding protein [Marinococcus luteus]